MIQDIQSSWQAAAYSNNSKREENNNSNSYRKHQQQSHLSKCDCMRKRMFHKEIPTQQSTQRILLLLNLIDVDNGSAHKLYR